MSSVGKDVAYYPVIHQTAGILVLATTIIYRVELRQLKNVSKVYENLKVI